MGGFGRGKIMRLQKIFDQAVAQKIVRRVDVKQLIWSIVSLNVFSFILWPVLQSIWPEDARPFDKAMRKREKAVVDLILNGLLPQRSV